MQELKSLKEEQNGLLNEISELKQTLQYKQQKYDILTQKIAELEQYEAQKQSFAQRRSLSINSDPTKTENVPILMSPIQPQQIQPSFNAPNDPETPNISVTMPMYPNSINNNAEISETPNNNQVEPELSKSALNSLSFLCSKSMKGTMKKRTMRSKAKTLKRKNLDDKKKVKQRSLKRGQATIPPADKLRMQNQGSIEVPKSAPVSNVPSPLPASNEQTLSQSASNTPSTLPEEFTPNTASEASVENVKNNESGVVSSSASSSSATNQSQSYHEQIDESSVNNILNQNTMVFPKSSSPKTNKNKSSSVLMSKEPALDETIVLTEESLAQMKGRFMKTIRSGKRKQHGTSKRRSGFFQRLMKPETGPSIVENETPPPENPSYLASNSDTPSPAPVIFGVPATNTSNIGSASSLTPAPAHFQNPSEMTMINLEKPNYQQQKEEVAEQHSMAEAPMQKIATLPPPAQNDDTCLTPPPPTEPKIDTIPFKSLVCPSEQQITTLKLCYGAFSHQGRRSSMEDESTVSFLKGKDVDPSPEMKGLCSSFIGVFDGHAGRSAASYVNEHLPPCIYRHLFKQVQKDIIPGAPASFDHDHLIASLTMACKEVDEQLLEIQSKETSTHSGCTAAGMLLCGYDTDVVPEGGLIGVVAHVGDSEVVTYGKDGSVNRLCVPLHRPKDPSEAERVRKAGGHVFSDRIYGMLAVSRAFGDLDFRTQRGEFESQSHFTGDLVISVPQVRPFVVPRTNFAIIACDGLFDVMEPKEACAFVRHRIREHQDVQRTAKELVLYAIEKKKSTDNVSAILIFFDN
eukprot:TRINITY_DN26359_c0_g1_i1.p1 TRINITY_DN26359_c0_g1~~TRINITY_DN26359_c0_g1_i1.p1  ORF type:complete len:802 (+),score=231.76 TRINITY_DN26359_c0_g1_i1:64-2469(+)